jgi:glutathionylspermidine synthase
MSFPAPIAAPEPAPLTFDPAELRDWLYRTAVYPLPYALGRSRLRETISVIPEQRLRAFYEAARSVSRLYDELCSVLISQSQYLTSFFSLSPLQTALWHLSGGSWQGLARADVFYTVDGEIRIAEINSDTPSGMDEAYLLGRFIAAHGTEWADPNRSLPEAFRTVFEHEVGRLATPRSFATPRSLVKLGTRGDVERSTSPTVGVVYPTDIPEDTGLLQIYEHWLRSFGFNVVSGSPWNLAVDRDGYATLFGTRIDLLLRHYKTDWWCEERSAWKNVPVSDAPPSLLRILNEIATPLAEKKLAIVNPFGTVVTQNKLSLAFFHEHSDLFAPHSQLAIRDFVPYTRRLAGFDRNQLIAEQDEWVLKSNYGCEGAEVFIGVETSEEDWKKTLELAIPEYWIVQRYFEAERDEEGRIENHGVYLAGGEPCGVYMRIDGKSTGLTSQIAPVLVRPTLGISIEPDRSTAPPLPAQSEHVAALLRDYTPTERWLPFRMPLLLTSAADPSLIRDYTANTPSSRLCFLASNISNLLSESDSSLASSLLLICDLPGPDSVFLASELAPSADVVLQIENFAHEREVVPLSGTLGALVYFAPVIGTEHLLHAHESCRPAVIVLDRRRLETKPDESALFNNRHWAYLPTVEALKERGIGWILYAAPTDEDGESDDLNEDFVACAAAGIRIAVVSAASGVRSEEAVASAKCGIRSTSLADMLEQNERQFVRRSTIFSTPTTETTP